MLRRKAKPKSSNRLQAEIVTLLLVDSKASKVGDFLMVYKLYLRMRMRKTTVEEQMQWVLIYMQGYSANIWKKNVLEYLEIGVLSFEIVEKLLEEIKEFEEGENELRKVMELKKIEQGQQTMDNISRCSRE